MKRSLTTMILLAAGLTLGGCVDDYGSGYGGIYSAGGYPYGYYNAYPGGYYRGDTYYRGGGYYRGGYPAGQVYRERPYRQVPRLEWTGRGREPNPNDGVVRGGGAGRANSAERNRNWSRNPAGGGEGSRGGRR